jgi:hypothetical protein
MSTETPVQIPDLDSLLGRSIGDPPLLPLEAGMRMGRAMVNLAPLVQTQIANLAPAISRPPPPLDRRRALRAQQHVPKRRQLEAARRK